MTSAQVLTPEDGLFGRVALHNKLLTLNEIVEIQLFLRAWHDAHWHARVLGYIIAEE
jgi:hypothetical protein